jgi:superfamily II DNA or RNA helicase
MQVKDLLLRLGTENLIKFIDNDLFKILQIRKTSLASQKNLASLVHKLNSGIKLFKNKISRDLIIYALKEREARLIGKLFNLSGKNIWDQLTQVDFKKYKNLKILLEIFDIQSENHSETMSKKDVQNPENIIPAYSLFPHQIDVMDKANSYFSTEIKKVIMHMPTGAGKTRTAVNLVCDYLKKNNKLVIWLAHTEELCQQAEEEFAKGWSIIGNREIQSYKLFRKYRYDVEKIEKGFLVMSLDYAYSLTKKDQKKFFKLARECKFVVMDEAHMSIAPSYKQVLDILVNSKTCLLGLTATPGRANIIDNENVELANFFSKQKATLKVEGYKSPLHYLQAKGYLAKVENIKLETSVDIKKVFSQSEIKIQIKRLKNGLDLSNDFIKKIASNEKRTNMIIETAIKESKNVKNKIIIFAGSLETGENINTLLNLEGVNSALISGETDTNERRYNIEKFKDDASGLNILVNYGVLTTGFDAPKANIAIIGRPTQSVTLYSQMVGRVMRGIHAGGKKTCKVITVKDAIYGFRDMSESFFYWEELWD